MRRDRIAKAVNNLKEALNAAQIRDVLRVARNGQQQGEGVNRTQRILIAYNTFSQHYKDFSADEKQLMAFFGLDPLVDVSFWSNLIEGEQASSRKLLSDVDVGAYNVTFVMPKLRDLLIQDNDSDTLSVTDGAGAPQEMRRLRVLVVEKDSGLTEPSAVLAVVRAMTELYDALSSVYGANGVSLAIGSIDSGGAKAFDFFGAVHVMEALDELFATIWSRVKHGTEETIRYQIEIAMMTSGFATRVKEAQTSRLVSDDQGQRLTRLVTKAIETVLRNGGYTNAMDEIHDGKPGQFLTPQSLASKPQLLEFKEEARVDSRRDELREVELEPLTASSLAASGSYGASSISASALNGARYPDSGLAASSLNGGGLNGGGHNGSGLNGSGPGGSGIGGSGPGGDAFGGGHNGGGSGRGGGGGYYGSSAYGASPSAAPASGAEQLYRPPSSNSREYRDSREAVKDLKDIFGGPAAV